MCPVLTEFCRTREAIRATGRSRRDLVYGEVLLIPGEAPYDGIADVIQRCFTDSVALRKRRQCSMRRHQKKHVESKSIVKFS
jgi:hypothetical protein